MKRLAGYEFATTADISEDHGGYEGKDGHIENGDLVLMKTGRDIVEEAEGKRREATAAMDAQQRVIDDSIGIEELKQHRVRSRGRRYFAMPG